MGASKSKMARTVPTKTRSFPSTPSPATRSRSVDFNAAPAQQAPNRQAASQQSSYGKGNAIDIDVRDPAFAQRLHKLGIVQPNPFIPLSQQTSYPQPSSSLPSSTTSSDTTSVSSPPSARRRDAVDPIDALQHNPALLVLRAREALQKQRDEEEDSAGRKGFQGKRFLDVGSLREVVRMRGLTKEEEIERKFGLAKGTVARVGGQEVVDVMR